MLFIGFIYILFKALRCLISGYQGVFSSQSSEHTFPLPLLFVPLPQALFFFKPSYLITHISSGLENPYYQKQCTLLLFRAVRDKC